MASRPVSWWLALLILIGLPAVLVVATTQPSVPSHPPTTNLAPASLEGRLDHFVDVDGQLPFEVVSQADFLQTRFVRLPAFRSLGYGRQTHWFHIELGDQDAVLEHPVLTIGSPELEELDVWVQRQDGGFDTHALGYRRAERGSSLTRMSVVPLDAFPGMHVYFRVRTTNAISVHAELLPVDAFTSAETRANFFHGLYFGILLIAVVLYAAIGARLGDAVMLAYAGYVASQALFQLGSTGYLPVLLTGQSAGVMDAIARVGWLGSAAFIVLMWDRLLNLKSSHPRIHRLYLFTVALNVALLTFVLWPSLVTAELFLIVKAANYLNVWNLLVALTLLLRAWRRDRRSVWMIYVVAFVIPALGALVNTLTNQGLLPWNAVTAHFYQLSALVHVLVMSYGLALRLRQLQSDKATTEREMAIVTQQAKQQRHFVAMLSHEFGNPLAAIDRSAQMLQFTAASLAPQDLQRLEQIRADAGTLAGFVEHFLLSDALDNGALKVARAPRRIRQLLDDAVAQQPLAVRSRIQVGACAETTVELDSTLIGIAINNLLTNALRYSPVDSLVALDAECDASGLTVRVTDHGPGLGADELAKLGDPYFRGAAALGKKGSGLGYHFTRRIVDAHGGTLTARSGSKGGLVVELQLPYR